jgi:hypothetical protein
MKSIKEYIINEHFVNCKNEQEMKQYGDIVWKILQKAYEYCGGIKNVESVDDLIKDTHLWKLYRKDNEIKAVICYTDRKGGRKLCLLGQDGSDDGRKMLKKMLEDDFKLKDRNSWGGFSGKAAITALKHGGIPVPSEIAVTFMGSKCKPYDEYWYNTTSVSGYKYPESYSDTAGNKILMYLYEPSLTESTYYTTRYT